VVGSGPNGLTAAIILAEAGLHTTILEAEPGIGGAARSAELTLPGFRHDVGSAVYPMAAASPAFASFPLSEHGLQWIQPPVPVAHPMDDGLAPILCRSLEATCERLGPDGPSYHHVIDPFVRHWLELSREILQPPHIPRNPWLLARFGYRALWPAAATARRLFQTESARALFAGLAAHSILPLESFGSAAFGWLLAITAHTVGWPIPQGGAQRIADALGSYFESLGGQIIVNTRISSLRELDSKALLMFDLTPKPFLDIAGNELPKGFRRALSQYRYGPGAFKMDWALSEPIPWRAPDCLRAGTVHVGGTLDEIAWAEREAAEGEVVSRPFVLVAQPTLFDPSRAPAGQHVAWG
jgi:phytoene dehydrogenase-like protein